MNKAFTLVELLAVLFLLGVITLVSVPNVIDTNKKQKEKEINEFKKTVENAAEVYVETHLSIKDNLVSENCISLNKLVDAKLLNSNLINPIDNKKIIDSNSFVKALNQNGKIVYEYADICG